MIAHYLIEHDNRSFPCYESLAQYTNRIDKKSGLHGSKFTSVIKYPIKGIYFKQSRSQEYHSDMKRLPLLILSLAHIGCRLE